jgi:hypothetical protein
VLLGRVPARAHGRRAVEGRVRAAARPRALCAVSPRFVTTSCRLCGNSPRRGFALRGRRYGRRSA